MAPHLPHATVTQGGSRGRYGSVFSRQAFQNVLLQRFLLEARLWRGWHAQASTPLASPGPMRARERRSRNRKGREELPVLESGGGMLKTVKEIKNVEEESEAIWKLGREGACPAKEGFYVCETIFTYVSFQSESD